MKSVKIAGYGSWKSPITSDLIVSGVVGLGQIILEGENVYWDESRPLEAGRNVIVKRNPDGKTEEVTPLPFNVGSRVHEYGGGAFWIKNDTVYFSNFTDQRIYRQVPGGTPEPVTPDSGLRYADGIIDYRHNRIICVCEDHSRGEVVNSLVTIALDTDNQGRIGRLVSGNDFYSSPRLSPGGKLLVWLTWNHPDMPWDSSELWIGEINEDGSLGRAEKIAGGPEESVCQPEFGPDGSLYFVSERTGWWNLYRRKDGKTEILCEMEAEFGAPQWRFGPSLYSIESPERIICAFYKDGLSHLISLNPNTRETQEIETPFTAIDFVKAAGGRAFLIAGSPVEMPALVSISLRNGDIEVLRRSNDITVERGYISLPQEITFQTEKGLTAHAFYYPPFNKDFRAAEGEVPPLMVISHGGPTGAASNILNLSIQYWTSRGFALVDVNYGGSSGFGRAYRQRLKGQWGIVDVDDCINAARYLINRGEVDPGKTIIRGGSAGGYTALAALTFRNFFKAGASYYGLSDLEADVKTTHKFESHYSDNLIGPYPERREIYLERSPINYVERLSSPVIFFQGSEDKIVLPIQSEKMVEALRRKGIPVAYLLFEGEHHGFRRAENIRRALEAELYFYSKIFGFEPAEPLKPVKIENLS